MNWYNFVWFKWTFIHAWIVHKFHCHDNSSYERATVVSCSLSQLSYNRFALAWRNERRIFILILTWFIRFYILLYVHCIMVLYWYMFTASCSFQSSSCIPKTLMNSKQHNSETVCKLLAVGLVLCYLYLAADTTFYTNEVLRRVAAM